MYIWSNRCPNACNWIIGAQESLKRPQDRLGIMTVWCKKDSPRTAVSVLQSQFNGKLQISSEISLPHIFDFFFTTALNSFI